jgi:hypothetical protein
MMTDQDRLRAERSAAVERRLRKNQALAGVMMLAVIVLILLIAA